MAACGLASISVPIGGSVSICGPSSSKGRAPIEMQGRVGQRALRTCGRKSSLRGRLLSAVSGRREGRVFARQGVESAKEDIGLLYPQIASSAREFEMVQSRRWSDAARDELAMLNEGGRSAREAFANSGEITELNMDRLIHALLREDGQSVEDYQRRAIFFNHIAEFFCQGKTYSAEKDESAHPARTMQILVDSILAEDGRSATDYNARAMFFAKSAEVFPFNAEVRPN